MTRYRWYQAEWPTTIRTLAKRIKAKAFNDNASEGFVIDRVRDDFLEARYVERLVYTDHVLDPFGRELTFERVEFRQVSFRVSAGWPGLELVDAPRSSQSLVSQLSEATDFTVAIVPLSVDVLKWAHALQEEMGITALVDSIQLGALQLGDGITAKAVLKGENDVRAACSRLTEGRKYSLEKVQLRLGKSGRGRVLLTSTATARVEMQDPDGATLNSLRLSLARVSS